MATLNAGKRMAGLIGLDEETVNAQILPLLDSFKDARALSNHLEGLLGFSPAATAFTREYVQARFPPLRASTSGSAGNGNTFAEASKPVVVKDETAPRRSKKEPKPRFPPPVSAPRAVASDGFATQGQAYIKGEAEQQSFLQPRAAAGSRMSKGSSSGSNLFHTGPNTSPATHPRPLPPSAPAMEAASSGSAIGRQESQTAADDGLPELTPTADMIALDEAIATLTLVGEMGGASTKQKKRRTERPCFCHARVHPVHPHVPQCTACGLIICSAMTSLVFAASSTCPSCASPLLSDARRAALVSKLSASRDLLADAQRARQARVREERRKAREDQRAARPPEELFPELGGSGLMKSRPRPVDVAMGRAVVPDAERKAKVLTLNSKTHKLKAAKPKKKTKGVSDIKQSPSISQGIAASNSGQANVSVDRAAPAAQQLREEPEESSEEEDEEEYDPLGLGLVPDPDDDGFSMHGLAGPPVRIVPNGSASESPSWWGLAPRLDGEPCALGYVPLHDRPVWGAKKAAEEEEVAAMERSKEEEDKRKAPPGSEAVQKGRGRQKRKEKPKLGKDVGALPSV